MKLIAIIEPGETVTDACRSAQEWADACEWSIEFDFNGIHCVAHPHGDWKHLAERQSQAQRRTIAVNSVTHDLDLIETGDLA